MGFFTDIGGFIMTPLYYAISGIMLGWHELFSLFLEPEGGVSWALSIIGLTVVIRILLIPLFVKQIKSQRNMQLIQPKVKELQKKYGHDRQRLGEETMKLYKDAGTNPFASCLPLLLQMPIFFALFRLLDQAAKKGADGGGRGFLSDARAEDFGQSQIWGVVPISDTFWNSAPWSPGGLHVGVMIVATILVIAMTATTFFTQRQLMSKNMPADALTGPYAQQQKILLYVLPLVFGISGVAFPIGVLLYWTTSNLWTMGQQFYVIRNNPAPGTLAYTAKMQRDAAKGKGAGADGEVVLTKTEDDLDRRPATRQQPKRLTKAQRQAAAAQGQRPPAAETPVVADASDAPSPSLTKAPRTEQTKAQQTKAQQSATRAGQRPSQNKSKKKQRGGGR